MTHSQQKFFYNNLRQKAGKKFVATFAFLRVKEIVHSTLVCTIPAELFRDIIEKEKATLISVASEIWGDIKDILINVDTSTNVLDLEDETVSNDHNEIEESKNKAEQNKQDEEVKSNKVAVSSSYKKGISSESSLTKSFSFENFIVGPSNDFAASVAKAIAHNPGKTSYNPCLIYGRVGLGKTHLLQAIANEVSIHFSKMYIKYISAEDFMNDFVFCSRHDQMGNFRNKYRKLDLLLIDDIQFLSGKDGTQDELFHTFNALSHSFKQMVFSSDRALVYIKDIEERLLSRFQSGMSVDLQPPTPETAMGILMRSLELQHAQSLVSSEVIEYISSRLRNNIRDMLGFLNRVIGYSKITEKIVTLDMIKNWALDVQASKKGKENLSKKILQEVANFFELGISDIKSGKRNKSITKVRRVATYLLREHTDLTYESIANMLKVSHPSSMTAVQSIEEELRLGTNEVLQEQINSLNAAIFE